MNNIEELRGIRNTITNNVAMICSYPWNDKDSVEHIKGVYNRVCEHYIKRNGYLEIDKLSKSEAIELGFVDWNGSLFLIPVWLCPIIKDGVIVISILNNVQVFKKDTIDMDSRFGAIAYGLMFND